MIVLNVTYKCKPEMREAFLENIRTQGIGDACRAEEGNLKYDYYVPTHNADEVLLVEKWRDADALGVHAGQPHIAKLVALKAQYVDETIIEKYAAE